MLCVCAVSIAPADPKPRPGSVEAVRQAKARFKQGEAYLDQKLYDQAIVEFEAAYALSPLPILLFNIAQALRLKGENDKALDTYLKFLAVNPEGPVADLARNHVAYLTKDKEARQEIERMKAAEEERRKREAEAARIAAEKAEAERVRLAEEARVREEAERKRRAEEEARRAEQARIDAERQRLAAIENEKIMKWTTKRKKREKTRKRGYILAGAGVGFGALATLFGVLGSGTNSSIQEGGFATSKDIANKVSNGNLYNGFGYAFAITGGLAIAGAVPLIVLNLDIGEYKVSATTGEVKGVALSGVLP